ncbi:MAG: hypothetical protein PHD48_08060 [Alphaproteobacteria bacterium]|nr:hypothetical protein [Alphaproteobacteria bacterium]
MKQVFTRKDLYDLVWSKPMTKVAEDFGLSDVALHKICKKHRVPNPGLGYWAKVAANKPAKKTPLFETKNVDLNKIVIREGFAHSLPDEIRTAHAEVKQKLRDQKINLPSKDQKQLHSYAELLKKKLSSYKPGSGQWVKIAGPDFFSFSISSVTADRVVGLANNTMQEAERAGFRLFSAEAGLHIEIDGELIPVSITEKTERVKHTPTDTEAKALKKWEDECERERRHGRPVLMAFNRPNVPEWDNKPSGQLILEIDDHSHWDSIPRKFSDRQSSRIEKRLSWIISSAAACAAAAKVRKQESARRAEEERLREIARRKKALEEKRFEDLDEKMGHWTKAETMRGFAAAAQKAYPNPSVQTQAWIDWILAAANRLDPLISRTSPRLLEDSDISPWENN